MLISDKLTQGIYERWLTVIASGLNKVKECVMKGEITLGNLMLLDGSINLLKVIMRDCENSDEYRELVKWYQHQSEFLKEEKARREKGEKKSKIVAARISGDVAFEVPADGVIVVNADGCIEEKSKMINALLMSGEITLEIPDEGGFVVNADGVFEEKSKVITKQAQVISGGITFEISNERR